MKMLLWRQQSPQAEPLLDEFFFDVKAEFTKGGVTEYLNWRSVRDEAGTIVFDNLQADIDFFQLSLGVSLVF